jgi:hypothetical protein
MKRRNLDGVKDNQIVGISVFDSMKSQTASSIKR